MRFDALQACCLKGSQSTGTGEAMSKVRSVGQQRACGKAEIEDKKRAEIHHVEQN